MDNLISARNAGSSYSEEPWGGDFDLCTMAKLVYGMHQSLDGYVDHLEFRPSLALLRLSIMQRRGNRVDPQVSVMRILAPIAGVRRKKDKRSREGPHEAERAGLAWFPAFARRGL